MQSFERKERTLLKKLKRERERERTPTQALNAQYRLLLLLWRLRVTKKQYKSSQVCTVCSSSSSSLCERTAHRLPANTYSTEHKEGRPWTKRRSKTSSSSWARDVITVWVAQSTSRRKRARTLHAKEYAPAMVVGCVGCGGDQRTQSSPPSKENDCVVSLWWWWSYPSSYIKGRGDAAAVKSINIPFEMNIRRRRRKRTTTTAAAAAASRTLWRQI